MQRAFEAANTTDDRLKTEEYLKNRMEPLLKAGNAHMVDWDKEPLPHEKNFQLVSMSWTPAKQLPYQANGFHRKKSPQRRRSDEMGRNCGSNGGQPKRARRDSSGSSSSDKSDQIEILHLSSNQVLKGEKGDLGNGNDWNSVLKKCMTNNCLTLGSVQKKTKAQKKAEKAAKKASKKQNKQAQKTKYDWKIDGGDTEARRVSSVVGLLCNQYF